MKLQDYLTNSKENKTVLILQFLGKDIRCTTKFYIAMFLILKTISFTGYADGDTPFLVKDNATNVINTLGEIG